MLLLRDALRDLLYSSHASTVEWECHFHLVVRINNFGQHSNSLLCLGKDWEAWGAQSGWVVVLISNSVESLLCPQMEVFLPLELRPLSRPVEHKVMGTGSQLCASGSLDMTMSGPTPIYTPWFLGLWTLTVGEIAPYIGWWLEAYTASWRALLQPCKVSPPSWCCHWLFKRPPSRQPGLPYIQGVLCL